jgi:thiamine transporter ThiT
MKHIYIIYKHIPIFITKTPHIIAEYFITKTPQRIAEYFLTMMLSFLATFHADKSALNSQMLFIKKNVKSTFIKSIVKHVKGQSTYVLSSVL